jgi:hypothetical protein
VPIVSYFGLICCFRCTAKSTPTAAAAAAPAEKGPRVFVGNLAFKTTADELKAHMLTASPNVVSVCTCNAIDSDRLRSLDGSSNRDWIGSNLICYVVCIRLKSSLMRRAVRKVVVWLNSKVRLTPRKPSNN